MALENILFTLKADRLDTDLLTYVLTKYEASLGAPETAGERYELIRVRRLRREIGNGTFSTGDAS